MIDLSIDVDALKFQSSMRPSLDSFKLDERLSYWENFQWNKYRHNWKWETEEYSFFFSYQSNLNNLGDRFRISYNPNKVAADDRMLMMILNLFHYSGLDIKIQSCDVAFDYEGVTTSDLIFDKGRKREYKIFKYPDTDYTFYLGKSGTSGSVKIYDKAKEETKGAADYSKTRYEVTIRLGVDLEDVPQWKCKVDLPVLYLKGVQGLYDDKDLSPTDRLLVFAVEEGYPMDRLTYRQRKKYDIIAAARNEVYTKIEPSQFAVELALKDFIKQLFN